MPKRKTTNIGTFDLLSGILLAADPLYSPRSNLHTVVLNALPGTWTAFVIHGKTLFGRRPIRLQVQHSAATPSTSWTNHQHTVPVDTAQVGFYDNRHFQKQSNIPLTSLTRAITELNRWADRIRNSPKHLANFASSRSEFDAKVKIWLQDRWRLANEQACSSKALAEVIPYGVVSRSGIGDGNYPVSFRCDLNGAVVQAAIDFI
jgi:Protein of unknown function (DUF4241)